MTVQPQQEPRCAADSSTNGVSPGSGMSLQPLAPAGLCWEASASYLLCTSTRAAWRDRPPYGVGRRTTHWSRYSVDLKGLRMGLST